MCVYIYTSLNIYFYILYVYEINTWTLIAGINKIEVIL